MTGRTILLRLTLPLLLFLSIVFLPSVEAFKAEDAVHEASKLLQKIKPLSSRSANTRQSGLLSSAANALSSLYLTGPSSLPAAPRVLNRELSHAVKLLEDAANEGNPDAIFLLAEMNFFGNYTHPRNYSEAFSRYHQLAELTGNSSAQHMVGFMYATGFGGAVEQDQSKAMLYYTFAAEGGDIRSEMALGYRHHIGISTPRDCEQAIHYYRKVADKAIEYLRSGPPGNHATVKDSYRIADEEGGVYGEGASVSSAGPNAKQGGPNSDTHAAFEDVLEYLDLMSRKGDLKATFSLAKLYYEGSRGMRRDLNLAKMYFMEVARAYWPKKGKPKQDVSPGTEKLASKAAGYLGRMFLRGEGMPQDFEKAQTWFRRGIANGDSMSQYSMGLMHLHGHGVPKDTVKAAEYFAPAADDGLASAQVRLGALFLDQGDVTTAMRYFDLAARSNHIEAFYYLAELIYQGIGRDRSCGMAAVYYKIVAEKAEAAVASFKEANEAYENSDLETALVDYMLAAEQGFENAQANVAYLLDKAKPRFSFSALLPFLKQKASIAADAGLALLYWTRSAKQSNIDSMVKMGDYYLGGIGASPDQEKAAACYQAAAETMQSGQAMWNLGWMHENGVGIEQDFHLAKRFYDQALETNREAYLPVKLSLLKLRARSAWNSFTRGGINSIQDEPENRRKFSLAEWINAFIEADLAAQENFEPDEWDSLSGEGMPGGDDLYDEFDDGILESLAIVALAAALAVLVVYRRRRADERERERQRQQQQQPGQQQAAPQQEQQAGQQPGGLFPQPGDPNFLGWAAGGVGH